METCNLFNKRIFLQEQIVFYFYYSVLIKKTLKCEQFIGETKSLIHASATLCKKIPRVPYSPHLQYSVLNRGFAYAAPPPPSSLQEKTVHEIM
jgi:hypothetical protein